MRERVVIILAQVSDIHANAVAAKLLSDFNATPAILDVANFPMRWNVNLAFSAEGETSWRICHENFEFDSKEVTGVWWRRPHNHRIAPEVKDRRARSFCKDEAAAAFQGWLHCLGTRVINPVASEFAANRKPYQLSIAAAADLTLPKTLVTSDPTAARAFAASLDGNVIFKVLTGTSWRFTETRRLDKESAAALDSVRFAPVIFQELVPAHLHIRATVVDDDIFCASIDPHHPGAAIDWRLDLACELAPHTLPAQLNARLLDLMRRLQLRFGAIDLILRPDGEYVFLEVNPSGQFLFCEIHAGLPISRAFASALVNGPPAVSSPSPTRA